MDTATAALTVTREAVDGPLATAWEDLADRAGAAPFARPGWLLPWAGAARVRLEALAAWRGSRLAAILPVAGARRHIRTPADWHTPWLEAVAEDAAARRALATALAGAGRPRVTVDFVLAGEATATAAAAALAAAGYRLHPRTRLESPYVVVEGTWEAYLGTLSAHRRSELRRRGRRLEAAGAVVYEVHDGRDRLPALLDEGFAVEAAGWKGAARTAIASDPALAAFYRQAASWAADRRWLRLAFLRLDGRALAFDLTLEAHGRHYLIKTGYDPAFTSLSPGLLLRLHMLERAFATGLESYEFCGAAEPWKLEWAQSTRPVEVIEAYAPNAAGSLSRASDRISRFAATRLRRGKGGR